MPFQQLGAFERCQACKAARCLGRFLNLWLQLPIASLSVVLLPPLAVLEHFCNLKLPRSQALYASYEDSVLQLLFLLALGLQEAQVTPGFGLTTGSHGVFAILLAGGSASPIYIFFDGVKGYTGTLKRLVASQKVSEVKHPSRHGDLCEFLIGKA